MAQWLRYRHNGNSGFGQLQGDQIAVYSGDLFQNPRATGEYLKVKEVLIDIPCVPNKFLALVDNFHALVTKLEHTVPDEPLYFLKSSNSYLAAGQTIRVPSSYTGKVIYEGELESLRRVKDDVSEVRNGFECGIGVKNYNDVREGDQIEVFEVIQVVRTL